MANARFIYDNLYWRTATTLLAPSVGSWLSTRPLSYSLNSWPKKVARSATGVTDVDVIIDLGSALTFNSIFIKNPKIHTGGKIVVYANATNSWGAPSFTSADLPTIDTYRKLTGLYFSNQTFRYVRVRFQNVAAASDYAEFGTIYLGQYYEPTYNITDKLKIEQVDPSRVVKAYDGERQAHQLTKFHNVFGHLEAMPAADKDQILVMDSLVGTTIPLIWSIDSALLSQTYYGYLAERIAVDYSPGTLDLWDIDIELEEAR